MRGTWQAAGWGLGQEGGMFAGQCLYLTMKEVLLFIIDTSDIGWVGIMALTQSVTALLKNTCLHSAVVAWA